MPSTEWTTDPTTTTNPPLIDDIQHWLRRYGHAVPRRDAYAIAKYLRLVIEANSRGRGVVLPLALSRLRLSPRRWQQGFEGIAPQGDGGAGRLFSAPKQLAELSFGLLVMLALCVAIAG